MLFRAGKPNGAAVELPLSSTDDGIAVFTVPDEVHQLPFGLYDLLLKAGNCICAKIRVTIPRCDMAIPSTCTSSTPRDLPPRDCNNACSCDCQCKPACDCITTDNASRECGNYIGEVKGVEIPLELLVTESEVDGGGSVPL